jgi:hypothetical protein
MRLVYRYFSALIISISLSYAKDTVIEDFEGDGFDSWQSMGSAFGLSPVEGKIDRLTGRNSWLLW